MENKRHILNKSFVTMIDTNSRFLDRDNECLMKYIENIRRYTVLDKEEEIKLIKEYKQTGSKSAKDKLINSNLRIVISLAKRYCPIDTDITDVISEGNIGLMTALENYDLSNNVRLATYANSYIVKYINEFLSQNGIIKQINRDRIYGVKYNLEEDFFKKNGYYPNSDQLMIEFEKRGWKPKDKKDLDKITIQSIDRAYINSDDDDDIDIEYGEEDENIIRNANFEYLKTQIGKAMESLTEIEKIVIIKKYGFDDGIEKNDITIADELGLREYKVKSIFKSAIDKLKNFRCNF